MTHTEHVHIDLGERSYDIAIGAGLLDNATAWQGLPKAGAALIVTNDTVAPMYLARSFARKSSSRRSASRCSVSRRAGCSEAP